MTNELHFCLVFTYLINNIYLCKVLINKLVQSMQKLWILHERSVCIKLNKLYALTFCIQCTLMRSLQKLDKQTALVQRLMRCMQRLDTQFGLEQHMRAFWILHGRAVYIKLDKLYALTSAMHRLYTQWALMHCMPKLDKQSALVRSMHKHFILLRINPFTPLGTVHLIVIIISDV